MTASYLRPIIPQGDLGLYLGMKLQPPGKLVHGFDFEGSKQDGPRIEVIVGTAPVERWFVDQRRDLEFADLADALHIRIAPTERAQLQADRRRQRCVDNFTTALNCLREAAQAKLSVLWDEVKKAEVELTKFGLHTADPVADLIASLPDSDLIEFLVPGKPSA